MPELLEIPEELIELILLCLQTPRDLLNLALTCKTLCEKIMPTHLNFIDISSDLYDCTLWKALNGCPKLAGRIRKLEVLDEDTYSCALKDGYKTGVRQCARICDGGATTTSLSDGLIDSVLLFGSSLRLMKNLNFLALKQPTTLETLHDVLITTSDPGIRLEALSINLNIQAVSLSAPLSCQSIYYHLTSFAFTVTKSEQLRFGSVFDHVIFRCPSLINLSLVSRSSGCFYSSRFFEHGNWPSLRRLTLFGWLSLFPSGTVLPTLKVKLAVSFFQKHPLLESLWVADTYGSGLIEQETFLCRSAFPSLRSLCLTNQIPIQILDRLYHIEDFEQIPTCKFGQAKSLRSCTFAPSRIDDIYALAKAIPHLERLAYSIDSDSLSCDEHLSYISPCSCPLDRVRQALFQLKNLTHLAIDILCFPSKYNPSLNDFRCLAEHLPKLKFFQLATDGRGPWYIIERGRGESGKTVLQYCKQPDTLFAEYHCQRWGDFFIGSLIEAYL